jgi:hypothetical protein
MPCSVSHDWVHLPLGLSSAGAGDAVTTGCDASVQPAALVTIQLLGSSPLAVHVAILSGSLHLT